MPKGARRLPEACLERLRVVERIVHAGDLSALSVLEDLEALGPAVSAVGGNVDEPALAERLSAELELEVGGARLAVVHDAGAAKGRLRRLRRRFTDADAVVFGHSHIPLHEAEGDFQIFNPGSPTERRRAPTHTMGMLDANCGRLTFTLIHLD